VHKLGYHQGFANVTIELTQKSSQYQKREMVFNSSEFTALNEAFSVSLNSAGLCAGAAYEELASAQLENLRATVEVMNAHTLRDASRFISHINSITSRPTTHLAIRSAVRTMLTGPLVRLCSAAMQTLLSSRPALAKGLSNDDERLWVPVGLSLYCAVAGSVLVAKHVAAAYEKIAHTVSADQMPFVDAFIADLIMFLAMRAMVDTMPLSKYRAETSRALYNAHGKIFVFLFAQQLHHAAIDVQAVAHAAPAVNLEKAIESEGSATNFVLATAGTTLEFVEGFLSSAQETYVADADIDARAAIATVRQAFALIQRAIAKLPSPQPTVKKAAQKRQSTRVVQLASRKKLNAVITTTHYGPSQRSRPGCTRGKCKKMVIVAFFAKWSAWSLSNMEPYYALAKKYNLPELMWYAYDVFDEREANAVQVYADAFPTYAVFYGEVHGTPTILHRFKTLRELSTFVGRIGG
jgi:hypothetical protein